MDILFYFAVSFLVFVPIILLLCPLLNRDSKDEKDR